MGFTPAIDSQYCNADAVIGTEVALMRAEATETGKAEAAATGNAETKS